MFAKPARWSARHQEIARAAGAVAREDPARAVRAVRSRREPDDQQSRGGIAEAGHRTGPVGVQKVGLALLATYPLAVGAKPGTALARHDLVADKGQSRHKCTGCCSPSRARAAKKRKRRVRREPAAGVQMRGRRG